MKSTSILCLLAVVSAAFAAPDFDAFPSGSGDPLLVQRDQQFSLFTDSRNLIRNLVGNLRNAAQDALTAVGNFTNGVREETVLVRDKIAKDIENLRIRTGEAVNNVWNRISNSSTSVRECVDARRDDASVLFNQTFSNTMVCVDQRIADISKQIQGLSQQATSAMEYSNNVLLDMQKCTENSNNLFVTGSCLGAIVVQVQTRVLLFTAQSGLSMSRVSLTMATLPAAMEVCAGTRLVQTGIETGRIIMQIGACSTSNIFNTMIGGTPDN